MADNDTPATRDEQQTAKGGNQPEQPEPPASGSDKLNGGANGGAGDYDTTPGEDAGDGTLPEETPPPGDAGPPASKHQDSEPPGTGAEIPPRTGGPQTGASHSPSPRMGSMFSVISALSVITLVTFGIWFGFFREQPTTATNSATVFLDWPQQETGEIRFRIMHEGRTENVSGHVQLLVKEFSSDVPLVHKTIAIEQGSGSIKISDVPGFEKYIDPQKQLVVGATFAGHTGVGTGDKSAQKIKGEYYIRINTPSPVYEIIFEAALWLIFISLLLEIALFSVRPYRATMSLMFGLMYMKTFFSISLPFIISLYIHANPGLINVMKNAPISLVQANLPDSTEVQWLLNIGGVVDGSNSSAPTIKGGIVVPFYMIALAMLGAGINMTLKVPKIQQDYDEQVIAARTKTGKTLKELEDSRSTATQKERATFLAARVQARSGLIQNFMYLLSAPFLAIAAFYLLHLAGEQIGTPILVVVGFATGLISDKVVEGIIRVGEKMFGKSSAEPPSSNANDQDMATNPNKNGNKNQQNAGGG